MAPHRIPVVVDNQLLSGEGQSTIVVGSPDWYAWLDTSPHPSFCYQTKHGGITVRREQKRNGWYWYAYRAREGKLHKAYLGKVSSVTPERLHEVACALVYPSDSSTTSEQGLPDILSTIQLTFFGVPRLAREGQPVALNRNKAIALLAYLAAFDRPQGRDHLLDLLWPMSSAAAGRKNLCNTLWLIRMVLGQEVIRGDQYLALDDRMLVDIRAFEQAYHDASQAQERSAPMDAYQLMVRLYQGSFLDGLVLDDAPEFELWLTGMRERFHEMHLRALQELVAIYRSFARWRDVMTVARTALAYDALQEPMYRALMEAHAHMGDRATALRQYDRLREMLDRELGVAPLRETDQLREEILSGNLASQGIETTSALVIRPSSKTQPFIGRALELDALDTIWRAAGSGQAQVVLISGEAGIGKSCLWQTWSAHLDPAITFIAHCLPTTQHLPFAPVADILRSPAIRHRLAAFARPPAAWLPDIVRLVPELGDLCPNLPPATISAPIEEQRRIFEALVQSLGLAPSRPMVLFLDDLHWADQTTLDWLGYLLHRVQDLPFLLVGTYRSEEAPARLTSLIATWRGKALVHHMPLARLTRDETARLIAALDGDMQRADVLYDQSDGNPYFLIELLRAEPGVVPTALTDLIARRLGWLSDTARQLLQAAVVLQPEIDFTMLRQTSGRSDEETLDALDELLAAGLLFEQGVGYSFGHPLIAHVGDAGLSGARRSILHRRAAEALERLSSARLSEVAGRLALHYREAGDPERAAHYAELAGERALTLAAPIEAAHFYEQALALAPTPARYSGLGLALHRQADLVGARTAFEAALSGFVQHGERRDAARICLELARTYLASGQHDEVVAWVQRGRAYLGDNDDPPVQALASFLLGMRLRASSEQMEAAAAHLNEALALATKGNALGLLPCIMLECGNVRAQQGDLTGAITCFREMIVYAQTIGDYLHEAIGYNNLAYHELLTGNVPAAREAVKTGLMLAEMRDLQPVFQWLYGTYAEIAEVEGLWEEAETWLRRGVVEAQRFGNEMQVVGYQARLGLTAQRRGKLTEAVETLELAHARAAALPAPYLQAQIELWLVGLYSELDREAAVTALDRVEMQLNSSDYAQLREAAAHLRRKLSEHQR